MRRVLILAALVAALTASTASAQSCWTTDLGGGMTTTSCGSSTRTDFDVGGGMTGSSFSGPGSSGSGWTQRNGGSSYGSYSCFDYRRGQYVPCR